MVIYSIKVWHIEVQYDLGAMIFKVVIIGVMVYELHHGQLFSEN